MVPYKGVPKGAHTRHRITSTEAGALARRSGRTIELFDPATVGQWCKENFNRRSRSSEDAPRSYCRAHCYSTLSDWSAEPTAVASRDGRVD